nr:MAG TPA: hypothetical protein [Caudoviricetes sp.]
MLRPKTTLFLIIPAQIAYRSSRSIGYFFI